jgi:AcrR family transcriptional regulator
MPKKAAIAAVETDEVRPGSVSTSFQSKIAAIVETATDMFNVEGAGAVSLNAIALRVGISRATLYHYVADRSDLLFQCYRRSCEMDADLLAKTGGTRRGLDQLLDYVRRSLDPERRKPAAINDLAILSQSQRTAILDAQQRNFSELLQMVQRGVADGSIRDCNEVIVARAVAGIVAYAPISSPFNTPQDKAADADAVADFISFGTASDPSSAVQCSVDISEFSKLNEIRFDRSSRSAMRVEQILMTASRLFNQRGAHGVTLDEIAQELGATRGAFYHYLDDKKQLIRLCLTRAFDLYEGFFDAAAVHGRTGQEGASIVTHLNVQAQASGLCPLVPWIGLEVMSAAQRQKQFQRMRGLLARTVDLAERGIADGTRRQHDTQSIARVRPGAYLWIPQWFDANEGHSPRRLADEIMILFHRGLVNF